MVGVAGSLNQRDGRRQLRAAPARRIIPRGNLLQTAKHQACRRIAEQLAFVAEIDALKSVVRQAPLVARSRREYSAEHSWHVAMFALVLGEDEAVDTGRVIQLLLVHDIVEIDAGDAPIHGNHDPAEIEARENAVAERLFGLSPEDQAGKLRALWHEFEAAETPEASCAKALDRLQPLLLNTLTGGGTWAENRVPEQQVHERYGPTIERGSVDLWQHARELVRAHFSGADTPSS